MGGMKRTKSWSGENLFQNQYRKKEFQRGNEDFAFTWEITPFPFPIWW